MPSWRDSTSQQAMTDLDTLLNVLLPFGQDMLKKHGEFYPYAAAITAAGEVEFVAGVPDFEEKHPRTQDVIAACIDTLTSRRDLLRAWGLVYNVRLLDGRDALAIDSEHREGHAIQAVVPYRRSRLVKGRIRYDEMEAGPGTRRIWPHTEPS